MAGSDLARVKHTTRVVPPSKQRRRPAPRSRTVIEAETRPVKREPEKTEKPERQKVDVTHQRKPDRMSFINNGSTTVKIEFLIGLALIVLSPLGNSSIQMDRNYVKRVISWILVFMMLFPMSSSSRPSLVRLANATGAVILLTISVKGTRSGFGVDVPALIAAVVAKIQPGGAADLGIPTPPPGVTVPIPNEPPGMTGTLTGPENGNPWTVGVGGDFTTPNIGHRGRFVE